MPARRPGVPYDWGGARRRMMFYRATASGSGYFARQAGPHICRRNQPSVTPMTTRPCLPPSRLAACYPSQGCWASAAAIWPTYPPASALALPGPASRPVAAPRRTRASPGSSGPPAVNGGTAQPRAPRRSQRPVLLPTPTRRAPIQHAQRRIGIRACRRASIRRLGARKQGAGQITESAIELGCSCAPIEYAPIRRGCNLGEEHPDRLFCTPELPVANTAEIAHRRFRRHAAMGGLFTLGDHGGGL